MLTGGCFCCETITNFCGGGVDGAGECGAGDELITTLRAVTVSVQHKYEENFAKLFVG